MQHRTEIDGLRAVAVVPVILFHAGFEQFSGGFVGVDVFFVISGFLITSLILSDMETGQFCLLDFYERRARRILPALFCVMATCLPLAWLTMVPFQLEDFSQSLVATLVFASNFLFFVESGYFEPEAELKPLLHTWSLAVEEQYYIFFPLFMLLLLHLGTLRKKWSRVSCARKRVTTALTAQSRTLMIASCALIAGVSLIWSQWSVTQAPAAAFYLLPSRGWEILAGALAALYLGHERSGNFSDLTCQLLSMLGATCILVSIFVYDEQSLFPGFNALVPVMGTVLVLLFTRSTTLVHCLLSNRLLVGIGLISYSAYLWHQPLIAFARLRFGLDLPLNLSVAMLLATALLSVVTWRFVETPTRRRSVIGIKPLLAAGLLPTVMISLFAHSGLRTDGFYEAKLAAIPTEYAQYVVDRDAENQRRRSLIDAKPDVRSEDFDNSVSDRKVLIVGDSISDDLLMSLRASQASLPGYQFRRLRLDDACVPAATAALRNQDEPVGTPSICSSEVTATLGDKLYAQAEEVVVHANFQRNNAETAEPFMRALVDNGKSVSVVGLMVFNDIASVSMKLHRSSGTPEETYFEALRNKYIDVNESLKLQVDKVPGARYLDKFSLFCSEDDQRCNILDDRDHPFFIDGNHMSVEGFVVFGQEIEEAGWFVATTED